MSDYGTPPPPPPAPGYNQPGIGATPPPNYLVWAILSTLFCCLPLGIASIVFAAQVNSKWQAGDFAGAQESSAKAKKFAIISAVAGIIVGVLYGILVAVGVLGANSSNGM
jgi:predicted secreted protein